MPERRSAGVSPFRRSFRSPGRDSGTSTRLADILVPSLSLLAFVCWLVLYRWYALLDHLPTPLFSFYSIPGPSRSQALVQTALVFLALPTIYCVTCCLIREAAKVSAAVKVAAVLLIVGAAVVNIWLYPVGVPDVFNYLVELKLVYIYHENPYLATANSYAADPFARFTGLLDVPLIYGPAWVVISSLPAVLAGFDSLLRLLLAYKLFSLIWLALGGLVVYAHHDDEKGRWLGVYSFLANPLVLFESVGNAHNDAMMTAFLLAAVLALRRRSAWAGPLATLSALVKWLALPFLPLFVLAALRRGCNRQRLFLSVLGSLALAVAVSAPFWAGGRMIGGIRRATAVSQGLNAPSLVELLREYVRSQHASEGVTSAIGVVFGGLFALSVLLVMLRVPQLDQAMVYTMLALALWAGQFRSWYLITVAGILALRPRRATPVLLSLATALSLLLYPVAVWAHTDSGLSQWQAHAFLAFFLILPTIACLALEAWLPARRRPGREGEGALTAEQDPEAL